jgi:hypothetical protein
VPLPVYHFPEAFITMRFHLTPASGS